MRIVVKIGSGVISKDGEFDAVVLEHIVEQIAVLRARAIEIILVTSGAVATGRAHVSLTESSDSIIQKQAYAAVGQIGLMGKYAELFKERNLVCAQILVTKEDFRDRQHYLNMRNCLENLLRNNIIPVVNENDVIAVTELIFTDNDELAGLLASQLNADAVYLLSSIGGVIDGDPKDPDAPVISEIDFRKDILDHLITDDRSASGRGGMHTKFGIAKKLATQGITTYIADGRNPRTIIDITEGKAVGTKFIPHRRVSTVKRRIAHSEGFTKGSITVNQCTEEALVSGKVMSLLPVGAIRIEGDFKKGDVVEIRTEAGKRIAFGITRYDSADAAALCGQKEGKALVHYDYLFIG